jgi:hypothetical protein
VAEGGGEDHGEGLAVVEAVEGGQFVADHMLAQSCATPQAMTRSGLGGRPHDVGRVS